MSKSDWREQWRKEANAHLQDVRQYGGTPDYACACEACHFAERILLLLDALDGEDIGWPF